MRLFVCSSRLAGSLAGELDVVAAVLSLLVAGRARRRSLVIPRLLLLASLHGLEALLQVQLDLLNVVDSLLNHGVNLTLNLRVELPVVFFKLDAGDALIDFLDDDAHSLLGALVTVGRFLLLLSLFGGRLFLGLLGGQVSLLLLERVLQGVDVLALIVQLGLKFLDNLDLLVIFEEVSEQLDRLDVNLGR